MRETGRHDEAIEEFRAAAQDPKLRVATWCNMALCHRAMGDAGRARMLLKAALGLLADPEGEVARDIRLTLEGLEGEVRDPE